MEVPLTFPNGQTKFFPLSSTNSTLQSYKPNKISVLSSIRDLVLLELDEKRAHRDYEEKSEQSRSEDVLSKGHPNVNKKNEELWVEKYRPKKFHQLISNPKINKEALSWLMSWNSFVFGAKSNSKKPKLETPSKKMNYTVDNFDSLGRPLKKILLLNGLPGCGKTTLAHTIANHAGYNCVEINASDEKNTAKLMIRIKNAFFNRSLSKIKNSGTKLSAKPQLLILDECDGLEKTFIQTLVSHLETNELTSTGNKNKFSITRPIIFICNDLYSTPALRTLRDHALVLNFIPPKSDNSPDALSLIKRLESIAVNECILEKAKGSLYSRVERLDPIMKYIADMFNFDLRLCLNALQLIKAECDQSSDKFELEIVKKLLHTFYKDERSNFFNIMEQVLFPTKQKPIKPSKSSFQALEGSEQLFLFGIHHNIEACSLFDSLGYQLAKALDELSCFQFMIQTYPHCYFTYFPIPFVNLGSKSAQKFVSFPRESLLLGTRESRHNMTKTQILVDLRKLFTRVTKFEIDLTQRILVPKDKKANQSPFDYHLLESFLKKFRKECLISSTVKKVKNPKPVPKSATTTISKTTKTHTFFTKVPTKRSANGSAKASNSKSNCSRMYYDYRTGFSNHVKQDITLRDFLRNRS